MIQAKGKKMTALHRGSHRRKPGGPLYLLLGALVMAFVGCGAPLVPDTPITGPDAPQLPAGNIVVPKSNTLISLAHDTLDFGSNLEQRWVEVEFDGDPALIFVISGESWVTTGIERRTALDNAIRLTVRVDRSQLPVGEHNASLTVGAVGANSVQLVIRATAFGANGPTGTLTISHQTLDFGSESVLLSTVLGNVGQEALTYTVESSVPWAQPSVSNGSLDGDSDTIHVRVSRYDLYPRTYFGWMEIRTNNGQIGVVHLILTVPDTPDPQPIPDGFDPDIPPNPVDPPDSPDPEPMQIIWFHSAAGWSDESLRLALASGRVTHVVVKGMHRADMSVNDPHVVSAIEIVRQSDAQLIWCRNLWPYENQTDVQQSDFFTAEYYERELEQLGIEADLIGVDLTAFDPEPYGSSVMKPLIKGGGGLVPLSEIQKQQLIEAVAGALDVYPPADYTLVAGTNLADNAYNFLNKLGQIKISQSTYYLNEWRIAHLTYHYDIFGAHLRTDPYRAGHPESPYFTIETLFERSDLYAEKDGLFLFASRLDALSVAQDLFDYSGN